MPFEKPLPEWNAQGVEPPQSLKNEGWEVEQKPPADYFNWIQYKTYEALKELQQKAGEIKTINGQSPDGNGNVNIDVDTSDIEQEIENLKTFIGSLDNLTTEQKGNLVSAINEVKQNVTAHKNDNTIHVTQVNKTAWNNAVSDIGEKSNLLTSDKSNLVNAVNELFTNVSNGKQLIGGAITDVDNSVVIPAEPTFQDLSSAIRNIDTGPIVEVGDLIIYEDKERKSTNSSTFVNIFEKQMLFSGSIRLSFIYYTEPDGRGNTIVSTRKNGVVIDEVSKAGIDAVTRTLDITVNKGDKIQIFVRKDSYLDNSAIVSSITFSINKGRLVEAYFA